MRPEGISINIVSVTHLGISNEVLWGSLHLDVGEGDGGVHPCPRRVAENEVPICSLKIPEV